MKPLSYRNCQIGATAKAPPSGISGLSPKGPKYHYGTKYGFCSNNFPYGLGKYSPYGYFGPFGKVLGLRKEPDRLPASHCSLIRAKPSDVMAATRSSKGRRGIIFPHTYCKQHVQHGLTCSSQSQPATVNSKKLDSCRGPPHSCCSTFNADLGGLVQFEAESISGLAFRS